MTQEEINNMVANAPKQFCDRTLISHGADSFLIALFSGANGTVYGITPQHVKAFSMSLAHNIAEFEKKFGAIPADWKPGMQSPIQISDLKNSDDQK